MNRFRFRFESVLRYRNVIEDTKKREFATALDHQRHEEQILDSIDGSISLHEKTTEESSQGRISVRDLQNRYNYARQLDKERTTQEHAIHRAAEESEKRRANLVEATKQRKIFEKIKERDYDIYQGDVHKEEQVATDEVSVQRFFRKKDQ